MRHHPAGAFPSPRTRPASARHKAPRDPPFTPLTRPSCCAPLALNLAPRPGPFAHFQTPISPSPLSPWALLALCAPRTAPHHPWPRPGRNSRASALYTRLHAPQDTAPPRALARSRFPRLRLKLPVAQRPAHPSPAFPPARLARQHVPLALLRCPPFCNTPESICSETASYSRWAPGGRASRAKAERGRLAVMGQAQVLGTKGVGAVALWSSVVQPRTPCSPEPRPRHNMRLPWHVMMSSLQGVRVPVFQTATAPRPLDDACNTTRSAQRGRPSRLAPVYEDTQAPPSRGAHGSLHTCNPPCCGPEPHRCARRAKHSVAHAPCTEPGWLCTGATGGICSPCSSWLAHG